MGTSVAAPTCASPHRLLLVDDNVAIHRDYHKVLFARREDGAQDLDALEAELFAAAPTAEAGAEIDYDLVHAHQGEEAVRLVAETRCDDADAFAVAFVDMRMPPGIDGLETVRRIWALDPRIEVVFCSAYSDYTREEIVAALGHSDQVLFLSKPFDATEVCELARELAQRYVQKQRARSGRAFKAQRAADD